MSDQQPEPGWWLASDGNWYPPSQPSERGDAPAAAPATATPPAGAPAPSTNAGPDAAGDGTSPGAAKLSGGEVVIVGGGALLLIGSFLEWFGADNRAFSVSWSGWTNSLSMFPLVPLSAALGVSVALAVLLEKYSEVSVPSQLAGLRRSDVEPVVAVLIALTTLSYPLRSIEGIDPGVGAWLGSVGAAALAVGTFMRRKELDHPMTPDDQGATGETRNAAYAVLGGAAAILLGSILDIFKFPDEAGNSAWTTGLFPLTLLPVFLGLVVAVPVGLEITGNGAQPKSVAGISWRVVRPLFALWTAIMMLCLLVGEPFVSGVGVDVSREPGFWLMLLGSAALAGGSIAIHRTGTGPNPPTANG